MEDPFNPILTHLVPLEAVNRLFIQVVFAHQFLCFAAESNFWWRHHLWLLLFFIHQLFLICSCEGITPHVLSPLVQLVKAWVVDVFILLLRVTTYDNAIIESEKSEDALNVFQDISSISFIMFINSLQLIPVHCHKVLCLGRDSRQKKRHKENVEEEK